MSLIEIEAIHKSFGEARVLEGIDLKIDAGEVIAIIGKSTLLRCINGLEPIDEGAIRIAGERLHLSKAGLRKLRLKVGMIFQQFNLFPHLTAGGNVMLAQRVVRKTPEREARAVAEEVLGSVGLADKFDAYPERLSGGQQQRVAIARSLAMRPVALLCDEITSALDPELVGEVLAVVRKLAGEGMTLAMVTHEMSFAREVCDRVIFMHAGRIHETGKPTEIFDAPQTAELRQFLGMTRAA